MEPVTQRSIEAGSLRLYSEERGVLDPTEDVIAATVLHWFVKLDKGRVRCIETVCPYTTRRVEVFKLDSSVEYRYSAYVQIDCVSTQCIVYLAVARICLLQDPQVCTKKTIADIYRSGKVLQVATLATPLSAFDAQAGRLEGLTSAKVQAHTQQLLQAKNKLAHTEKRLERVLMWLWVLPAILAFWTSLILGVGKVAGWRFTIFGLLKSNLFELAWTTIAAPVELLLAGLLYRHFTARRNCFNRRSTIGLGEDEEQEVGGSGDEAGGAEGGSGGGRSRRGTSQGSRDRGSSISQTVSNIARKVSSAARGRPSGQEYTVFDNDEFHADDSEHL